MQPLTLKTAHYYGITAFPISRLCDHQRKGATEFLDYFSWMVECGYDNLKYLVAQPEAYKAGKTLFAIRPVFTSTSAVVLENRTVSQGMLVPAVAVVPEPGKRLAIMNASRISGRAVALLKLNLPWPWRLTSADEGS